MMETKFFTVTSKHVWLWMSCLALFFCLATTNVNAQCRAVKLDADENIIGLQSISCNFPVLLSTDLTSSTDLENYTNEVNTWMATYPGLELPSPARGYIEIRQTDFDAMDAARKTAMEQLPNYYRVIAD
jgi:hypothetical protein